MAQLSIFSLAGLPANPSQSQDSERDWQTRVATWPFSFLRLLTEHAPAGWSGRTSPASCHQTADGILEPSWGGLAELGYGWAYRVLDAQYFGVAQRRRRVFVVGYLGDWRRAAAVLFERDCLSGNPAPSRDKRKAPSGGTSCGPHAIGLSGEMNALDNLAGTLDAGSRSGGGQPSMVLDLARCVTTGEGNRQDYETTTLIAFNARQDPDVSGEITHPLGTKDTGHGQAMPQGVRRLIPRECERLQGFPDDYTLIPYRGKGAADGPRYKALGNSMAVPVMRWIGQRIQEIEGLASHSPSGMSLDAFGHTDTRRTSSRPSRPSESL